MKKDLAIIFGLFLVIVGLLIFGQGVSTVGYLSGKSQPAVKTKSSVTVTAKTFSVEAEVADNPSERKKGLSKRDSLDLDKGMLFVFETPGPYAIWMKDMKFAIDIIWLDENKRIVDIVVAAAAESDKKDDELTIYRPRATSLYVLEINANLVPLYDLKVGDYWNFQL